MGRKIIPPITPLEGVQNREIVTQLYTDFSESINVEIVDEITSYQET